MKYVWMIVGLVTLLAMGIGGVGAQDAPCAVADVLTTERTEQIGALTEALTTAQESDDMAAWITAAADLRAALSSAEAECRGLSFSSEVDGEEPVIGPLSFASGIWRATFTVNGVASVEVEAISGTCDPKSGYLFVAVEGDGTEGAETIYKAADGCETLIMVSHVNGDWTLTFEPIKLDDE